MANKMVDVVISTTFNVYLYHSKFYVQRPSSENHLKYNCLHRRIDGLCPSMPFLQVNFWHRACHLCFDRQGHRKEQLYHPLGRPAASMLLVLVGR